MSGTLDVRDPSALPRASACDDVAGPGAGSLARYGTRPVLLTNARRLESGAHDGTLIVPWPPYT